MTSQVPAKNFREQVLKTIRLIPYGKVLSYGLVACMAGSPRASRIVGGILYHSGLRVKEEKNLPWQRVVNQKGELSTYRIGLGDLQKKLLKREGVYFDSDERIPLKKFLWKPPFRLIKKLQLPEEILWELERKFDF